MVYPSAVDLSLALPHSALSSSLMAHTPILVDCLRDRRIDQTHWHDYVQVWYSVKGTVAHWIDGVRYLQEPGCAVVILPYMNHAIDSFVSEEMPEILSLSFDDGFLTQENISFFSYDNRHSSFEGWAIPTLSVAEGPQRCRANELAGAMIAEFDKRSAMSVNRLRLLTYEFLSLLCVDANSRERKKQQATPCIRDRGKLITDAARYLSANLTEKVSIASICSVALMSRRMFTENFREITGITFSNYYIAARLKKASHMLAITGRTLDEIAEQTGFSNKGHLSYTFTKHIGISPAVYRNNVKRREVDMHNAFVDKWKWMDPTLAKIELDTELYT